VRYDSKPLTLPFPEDPWWLMFAQTEVARLDEHAAGPVQIAQCALEG
jgi:hypothetical protein